MELITILNHCHRYRGFVYQHARFGPDKKSIEVDVRPREGSAAVCSKCHKPGAGLRSSSRAGLRVYSSLGLSGFSAVPHAACGVPELWRGGRGSALERWEAS